MLEWHVHIRDTLARGTAKGVGVLLTDLVEEAAKIQSSNINKISQRIIAAKNGTTILTYLQR